MFYYLSGTVIFNKKLMILQINKSTNQQINSL